MEPRRSKRAGRPRLDASRDAILSADRRSQVRRAQRTYRLKKEAAFRNATARAEQLQARMRTAAEEVTSLSEIATEAQLHLSHPDIYASLKRLYGIINANGHSSIEAGAPAEPSADSSDQVSVASAQVQSPRQCPPTPPLPTRQYTYAFQEVRFARQLQRYSLEHAFRLYTEFRSDPREIHRVFRLVPCVRDRGKTQPRFRQLLMGGRTDPLEVPGLPFYTVGGAGTHFPDVNEEGNAIYPANSRMPRRVLGILPWPELETKGSEEALEAYGLGGEWFDSRDVEGYLRLHGVDVKGGLFPTLHISSGAAERDRTRSFVLDVEGFFSRLLSGLVILGRAPGFRKTDAYAGNILAINAAFATVTAGQHMCSISSCFVRPRQLIQNLICRVERIRDTQTF
ncbi:hypothetical protein CNMCM8980_007215 [Aspergillus fumigatiaffinis]|uniref:BZIP domain-containing protein n=1 Tax=Aspergillus fumigatiaffinis TaxID=340414 RepID=A0A8H4HH22_9EURO|nr:hypothetical protein CNMCM6805_009280 [Aspergillus fumigatiaffinis]KAF4247577.1 hypothetical protein CNMCM8980_007215 [Aspergillus fumigatiaffinis]